MRRVLLALAFVAGAASPPAIAEDDIVLRGLGSFHVGGRIVEISGKPVREIVRAPGGPPSKLDPNGRYQVEQMYVQYFLPRNRKGKVPLLLWHGGGLTGATYETTPDGREGWLNLFLRKGWDVYNSDAVERGRSSFAGPDVWPGEPIFLTQTDPYERFRIGQGAGSYDPDPAKRKLLPGNQFPVEAYEQFTKQIVPRWLTTDAAVLEAYLALIDRVCPCVLLVHSQGGVFGYRAAELRPDKVKAIVGVEPAGVGSANAPASVKHIPMLMVFGDYVDQDSRWVAYRKTDLAYADAVKAAGGAVDVVSLPDIGIRGNSHMLMMDKNNAAIADVINGWLVKKGLAE